MRLEALCWYVADGRAGSRPRSEQRWGQELVVLLLEVAQPVVLGQFDLEFIEVSTDWLSTVALVRGE